MGQSQKHGDNGKQSVDGGQSPTKGGSVHALRDHESLLFFFLNSGER